MLQVSRQREEATIRDSYRRRHLPQDKWQITAEMLWIVQQGMEFLEMDFDVQMWTVFAEYREDARFRYAEMEEQGLVWESEV